MGSLRLKTTVSLLAALFVATFAQAQIPFLNEVLILSGGEYGNPANNITLRGIDPTTGSERLSDTIHSQSVQDLIVEGDYAYIAAQDSLIKIDLSDLSRVASTSFPGPSTNVLALYDDQLLVGNFHSQTDSNLYVFNKNTLALEHIVGGVLTGVKGIVVIGDTAYLAQNLTSSTWSDSAGYLSLVYLPTGTFIKDVPGDGVSDIGRLFVHKGGVMGFGSSADVISRYEPTNGIFQQSSLGLDLQTNYGSTLQLVDDTLYGIFNGKIGSINVFDLTVIDTNIVDTLITAFAYDTISGEFYVTQTDYFSYTRGIKFNSAGTAVDTFVVGASPEVLSLVYKTYVGVNEVEGSASFTVYPNPTSGLVWVRVDAAQNTTLLLRDLTGRVLQTVGATAGAATTIDISALPTGMYLLQSADGSMTKKVVKQ